MKREDFKHGINISIRGTTYMVNWTDNFSGYFFITQELNPGWEADAYTSHKGIHFVLLVPFLGVHGRIHKFVEWNEIELVEKSGLFSEELPCP